MNTNKGFSLVEVIVSALLIGLAFNWYSTQQTLNLKHNTGSFQRSSAVMLANYMMDAMRADRIAAVSGAYNLSSGTCDDPSNSGLVGDVQADWFSALKRLLGDDPNTCVEVDCSPTSCSVEITWKDSRNQSRSGQSGTAESFKLISRVE